MAHDGKNVLQLCCFVCICFNFDFFKIIKKKYVKIFHYFTRKTKWNDELQKKEILGNFCCFLGICWDNEYYKNVLIILSFFFMFQIEYNVHYTLYILIWIVMILWWLFTEGWYIIIISYVYMRIRTNTQNIGKRKSIRIKLIYINIIYII